MAYATNNPPVLLASRYDGGTGSLWSYISADDPATIAAADYISNALNLGLKVGDVLLCSESDNAYTPFLATVASISSGAATLSLDAGILATEAGTGITAGTGTVYESGVEYIGGVKKTTIYVDLTGLNSQATDGDIIGVDATANPCHFGQITAAQNGTIVAGRMTCLEVPAGGDPNVDVYSATEGTGVEDQLITALTETLLLDAAGDWAIAAVKAFTAFPAADEYLYLTQGDATGTNATYTAGKFLIELYGV